MNHTTGTPSDQRASRQARSAEHYGSSASSEAPSDASNRSARYDRDETDAETSPSFRRASYQPPERDETPTDLVRAFRDDMIEDVERPGGVEGEKRGAARAAARAEQGLGRWEEAGAWLERIREHDGSLTRAERRMARNILRRSGASDGILASLHAGREASSGTRAALLALEGAEVAWRQGCSPFEIFDWLETIDWDQEGASTWSLFRETQTTIDARLERGDPEGVREALESGIARLPEMVPETTALIERLAAWHHLQGRPREAFESLEHLRERGPLGDDLGDLYRFLGYELGEYATVHDALVDRSAHETPPAERTVVPTAFEIVRCDDNRCVRALDWIEEHTGRERADRPGLRARSHLLEQTCDQSNRAERRDDLLEVLQRRLDDDLETFERLRLLVRLGELHERHESEREAVVSRYVEALDLRPGWPPALRRLGDTYAQCGDGQGLAELREYELESLDDPIRRTRRHRELGHLYRHTLDQPREALAHYRKVLEFRGYDRDALEGAAEILAHLACWDELVELCHTAAARAPDDIVRAEWWTRAADIAERHLDDLERAATFRRDVLELEVDGVETWTSLQRIHRRADRWQDLMELFERRIDSVESSPEVVAELCLRAARLCEERLEMPGRARHYYRRGLEARPDHQPLFDGWRRHLRDAGDWEALADVLEREIESLEHAPRLDQTRARLADVVGRHLERRDEAAEHRASRLDDTPPESDQSDEAWRLESALRHRRALGDWEGVADLLGHRASRLEGRRRGLTMGEAGWVSEWHLEYPQWAFDCYLAALEAQPAQLHWLDGLARTWSEARVSAEELAETLEDRLMELGSEEARDAYFKVLARLRERDDRSAEAGRAYRTHGDRESRENRVILRIAMAQSGEREMLHQARRHSPRHARTRFAQLSRTELASKDLECLDQYLDDLTSEERELLLGEFDLEVAAPCIEPGDPADLRLGAAVANLLADRSPPTPTLQPEAASPPEARLRTRLARREGSPETEENWMRAELEYRHATDVAVDRLVELARRYREVDRDERVETLHGEAAAVAFPELLERETASSQALDPERWVGEADESTLDVLYDSMRRAEQWQLLEASLRAHVSRDDLSNRRRTELFAAIAEIARDRLDDLETAARALECAWKLSSNPAYLRQRVDVELEREAREQAIECQRLHFQVVSEEEPSPSDDEPSKKTDDPDAPDTPRSVTSGLELAELLLEGERTRREGTQLLEQLRQHSMAPKDRERLLRHLGRGYLALDELSSAIDAFRTLLEVPELDETLGDWQALVSIYSERGGDPGTAYELQWRLVREKSASEQALDQLVELAGRSDSLEDCVQQLEDEAELASDDMERQFFARASRVAADDLGWHDKAVTLVSRAIEAERDTPREFLRARTLALARSVGREEEALAQFRQYLEVDAADAEVYRALLEMFEREQVHERTRLVRQLLRLLDGDVDDKRVRKKMTPSRPFDDEALEAHLLPDALPPELFYLLQKTVPLLHKVAPEVLPDSDWPSGRLSEPADPLRDAFDDATYAFDLGRYRLETGEDGPASPRIVGDKPSFWMPVSLIESLEGTELHFTAGYLSALAWSNLAPLMAVEGSMFWHLIDGTWLYQKGECLSGANDDIPPETRQMKEAVSSPLLTMTRRRVVGAIESAREHLDDPSPEQWPQLVEQFTHRVGLALCGDLEGALRALMQYQEPTPASPAARQRLMKRESVSRLVQFAFTDDYLAARYDIGLGGRPSQVGLGRSL